VRCYCLQAYAVFCKTGRAEVRPDWLTPLAGQCRSILAFVTEVPAYQAWVQKGLALDTQLRAALSGTGQARDYARIATAQDLVKKHKAEGRFLVVSDEAAALSLKAHYRELVTEVEQRCEELVDAGAVESLTELAALLALLRAVDVCSLPDPAPATTANTAEDQEGERKEASSKASAGVQEGDGELVSREDM
jgi:hypothetical protein